MRQLMGLCAATVLAVAAVPAMASDCPECTKIKAAGHGFCDHCKFGMIYATEIKNEKLYDVLAGEDGMINELKNGECQGCKKAAESNGHCDHCGIFVANGHVFLAKTAWQLALGTPVTDADIVKMLKGCPGCGKASKENGFCSGCSMGYVGGNCYKSKDLYDGAVKAIAVFKDAIKDTAKCEQCAIARVSDGKCRACNVTFKDGKPVS